jgi:hypothetical protein
MHFCCNAGSLVSGATPFPEDPTDYYAHPALGFVGCNQLFCRGCNSFVRSVAGLGFALPNMQVDLGALYDRPVLLEAPELAPTYPERRLYLCRCSRWLEQFNRPVFIAEPDPLTDPTMPWMCGGHLVRVLPCDLDGLCARRDRGRRDCARRKSVHRVRRTDGAAEGGRPLAGASLRAPRRDARRTDRRRGRRIAPRRSGSRGARAGDPVLHHPPATERRRPACSTRSRETARSSPGSWRMPPGARWRSSSTATTTSSSWRARSPHPRSRPAHSTPT